jgi:hypothetical protein
VHDLVIRGGTVVDGIGTDAVTAAPARWCGERARLPVKPTLTPQANV